MTCLILFAIWHCRDQHGSDSLAQFCSYRCPESVKVIEQIAVGVVAALGILTSFACVIASGVSKILSCESIVADSIVILNVVVTVVNAIACTQVFVVYYWKQDVQEKLMSPKDIKKKAEMSICRQTSV